jgi:glycosyltransferase involved in cell wall biosynthesis
VRLNIITGFFLPVPPLRGGATEKVWAELAKRFAAQGHHVTFVSRAWPGLAGQEQVDGVHHLRLPGHDHTSSLAHNLWLDFRWGLRVARHLPAAEVTICNTVSLPIWLRRIRPSAGRVAAVVARMPKGQGLFYGKVDRIYALSAAVQKSLVAEDHRLAERIRYFPFPIDWQRHAAAKGAAIRMANAPLSLAYIGRIHPEKGIDLLLAAAAHLARRPDLPAWRLSLCGPQSIPQGGGGESYVAALHRTYAMSLQGRLEISGPEFDARRLAVRYAAADIFCYPSRAEGGETFGVAVAEAMAAGAAPVVSKLACFEELVREGATGLVFDHHAPDASSQLAAQLELLLRDSNRRTAIANRAMAHARQFDFGVRGQALIDDLTGLIGEAGI